MEDSAPHPAASSEEEKPGAPPDTQHAADALAAAQLKIAELEEQFLRAKADTENTRRRAQEDLEKAYKFAIERFAEELLPVIDSLEAAAADTSGELGKLREGVALTLRQLNAAFDRARVCVIHPAGEKFDPHRHQAISTVPADQAPNTVVSVLQKGYLIENRVLRPALVTVCQPESAGPPAHHDE
ncbi:HSP-70 cofactor [Candidatus Glomeribacter gigasporarum BEG34]|uniref:Protein GrpE n=1 Tax=Candidatus Glomeribacter gigasporarum BEG34 TaxID=1070319 RepID=G2J9R7_9BURK|nr:nucleotide exchange factor GrpE [Candidatus Glomeribacter gigasporarum]CCD29514.1 HSP-70 cofactor [Candidatus Glomeribacter gigasporarum BEG34]